MNLSRDIRFLISGIGEIVHRYLHKVDIYYVVENNPWAIMAEGKNITSNLTKFKGEISIYYKGFPRNSYVHYGTFDNIYRASNIRRKDRSKIIGTCYHIDDNNPSYACIPELDKYIGKWHTSCNITKQKLLNYGIAEDKIVVIPIGVDLEVYYPERDNEIRNNKRRECGIPEDAFVIASFQKDGDGWEEGLSPKLIKGPDVFCEVIECLYKEYPNLFVLLSGPARGYVKKRLEGIGINYHHVYLENPDEVSDLYRLSDCYIVASREEGGPKAVLESMASGVPLVTTKVGQAPDIVENGTNAVLTDIEDVKALCDGVRRIIKDDEFRNRIIKNGLDTAQQYDIRLIVDRYERELYT